MAQIKVTVNRWLRETLGITSNDSEEVYVSVPEEESVLGMINRLADENGDFWKRIFDEQKQEIGTNLVVTINGRIVNPYDRSEAVLHHGDEVTFLAVVDGG